MKYSKEIFKKHYGKPYLNRIKYTLISDMVAAIAIILFLATGITLSSPIAIVLVGVIVLSIFPFLPLFASYYVKAIKMSQRQKQWFEKGILHVLLVPEDGFTWGAITTHTKEYIFKTVSNVSVESRYIIICGEIELIEKYNETTDKKKVSHCKVPRNFTHESKIINIGGISDAN